MPDRFPAQSEAPGTPGGRPNFVKKDVSASRIQSIIKGRQARTDMAAVDAAVHASLPSGPGSRSNGKTSHNSSLRRSSVDLTSVGSKLAALRKSRDLDNPAGKVRGMCSVHLEAGRLSDGRWSL